MDITVASLETEAALMPQPDARSGLTRPRFRLHATLVLAAVTAAACGRTPVAKVTRADGTALIGEVVGTRPDVVILRLRAGEDAAISRATIKSIVVPTVDEMARHTTASEGPGTGGSDASTDASNTAARAGGGEANRDAGPGAGPGGSNASEPNAGGSNAGSSNPGGSNSGGSTAGSSNAGGSNAGGSNPREADAGGSRGAGGSGAPGGAGGTGGGTPGGGASKGGTPGGGTPGGAPGGGFVVRDAVIPENTALTVALDAAVASDRTAVNAPIEATLTAPVNVPQGIALPAGTRLRGAVTEVVPSSLARGRGRLTLHFHSLVIAGETIAIDTDALPFRAPGLTRDDAKKIGIGAAIGAGIGKVVGKTKRGLGIGGAAGAAGTAAVVSRKDVELGRGTVLRVTLNEPVALGAARDR
jgi:hypothetical protein